MLALELSAFGVFGLAVGCYTVLLADLSRTLGLSPGPLGVALFLGATASVAGVATLGWAFDRPSGRSYLTLVFCCWGTGIAGLAFAGSYPSFVAAQIIFSAAGGLYDVGINAVAVDLERLSGRRLMSYLHAAYSGGAVAGAVVAGALVSAGADYRLVYLSFLVPLAGLTGAVALFRLPEARGQGDGAFLRSGTTEDSGGRWGLYSSAPLLLVGAVFALGGLAEGEMESWGGIYLRDSLGLGALVGGSGVAAFYAAMTVGRLGAGWAAAHAGNRRTLIAAGLLVALGMTLALATGLPALAVGGFLLVGLGVAGVAPLTYSAAGDLVPERAGAAVSVVTTLGYGTFLLGPTLVGGLAELVGLRIALGVIAVAGLASCALSYGLKEDREKPVAS